LSFLPDIQSADVWILLILPVDLSVQDLLKIGTVNSIIILRSIILRCISELGIGLLKVAWVESEETSSSSPTVVLRTVVTECCCHSTVELN
jgi:hypothetical protein